MVTIYCWYPCRPKCKIFRHPDLDAGTLENANLIFGPMANVGEEVVSQSFVATAADEISGKYAGRPRKHRLVLPPPDEKSWRRS